MRRSDLDEQYVVVRKSHDLLRKHVFQELWMRVLDHFLVIGDTICISRVEHLFGGGRKSFQSYRNVLGGRSRDQTTDEVVMFVGRRLRLRATELPGRGGASTMKQ